MKADAPLHVLRTIARAIDDGRARQEAESARFNLWAALDAGDVAAARQWLAALRVSLETHCDLEPGSAAGRQRDAMQAALREIARLINEGVPDAE